MTPLEQLDLLAPPGARAFDAWLEAEGERLAATPTPHAFEPRYGPASAWCRWCWLRDTHPCHQETP